MLPMSLLCLGRILWPISFFHVDIKEACGSRRRMLRHELWKLQSTVASVMFQATHLENRLNRPPAHRKLSALDACTSTRSDSRSQRALLCWCSAHWRPARRSLDYDKAPLGSNISLGLLIDELSTWCITSLCSSFHIFALISACNCFSFSMSVFVAGHPIPSPSV